MSAIAPPGRLAIGRQQTGRSTVLQHGVPTMSPVESRRKLREKGVGTADKCSQSDARMAGVPAGQTEAVADVGIRQDGVMKEGRPAGGNTTWLPRNGSTARKLLVSRLFCYRFCSVFKRNRLVVDIACTYNVV